MISQKHGANLANLIRLSVAALSLQIDFFFNASLAKEMMTALDPLVETKTVQ